MMRNADKLFVFVATLVCWNQSVLAQEAVMEEVTVEGAFISQFEKHQEEAIKVMTERLLQLAETKRSAELEVANRTPLNTLLQLTKYSPIPLGGSDPRIDHFALESYMRADLNPRAEKSIFTTQ
jgi:hypothetical protein